MTQKIQVNTGTGWATYDEQEGQAVINAFKEVNIPVKFRYIDADERYHRYMGTYIPKRTDFTSEDWT